MTKNKLRKKVHKLFILKVNKTNYIIQGKIKHKQRIVSLIKNVPDAVSLDLNKYVGMTVKDIQYMIRREVVKQVKFIRMIEGG